MRIPSSDHVSVAVHEFGGRGRPLLISHATGFHGHCYLPMADELNDHFTTFAIDHRGHGATARPDDWAVDWSRFGDDAVAAAEALAPDGGLVGFGHSMGGAALLMAAAQRPDLFDVIIAVEPIVFPSDPEVLGGVPPSGLADGARRRRPSFESFDAAIENYRSKPPMDGFDPDAVRLYVAHGFRPAPEGVRLKCDPEHEARTFESSWNHGTWDRLPEIGTPVVVVASGDGQAPAMVAPLVADRLADAELVELPEANHFWPFVDPVAAAELVIAST